MEIHLLKHIIRTRLLEVSSAASKTIVLLIYLVHLNSNIILCNLGYMTIDDKLCASYCISIDEVYKDPKYKIKDTNRFRVEHLESEPKQNQFYCNSQS